MCFLRILKVELDLVKHVATLRCTRFEGNELERVEVVWGQEQSMLCPLLPQSANCSHRLNTFETTTHQQENLDAALEPLLLQQKFRQGGTEMIKVCKL